MCAQTWSEHVKMARETLACQWVDSPRTRLHNLYRQLLLDRDIVKILATAAAALEIWPCSGQIIGNLIEHDLKSNDDDDERYQILVKCLQSPVVHAEALRDLCYSFQML